MSAETEAIQRVGKLVGEGCLALLEKLEDDLRAAADNDANVIILGGLAGLATVVATGMLMLITSGVNPHNLAPEQRASFVCFFVLSTMSTALASIQSEKGPELDALQLEISKLLATLEER